MSWPNPHEELAALSKYVQELEAKLENSSMRQLASCMSLGKDLPEAEATKLVSEAIQKHIPWSSNARACDVHQPYLVELEAMVVGVNQTLRHELGDEPGSTDPVVALKKLPGTVRQMQERYRGVVDEVERRRHGLQAATLDLRMSLGWATNQTQEELVEGDFLRALSEACARLNASRDISAAPSGLTLDTTLRDVVLAYLKERL